MTTAKRDAAGPRHAAHSAHSVRPVLRGFAAVAAVVLVGAGLGAAARAGAIPVDDSLTRHLSEFTRSHPAFETAMRVLTFLGSTAFLVGVVSAVALTLFARSVWKAGAMTVAITAVGATMCALLKVIVGRPRPPASVALVDATGKSFPSGHAMNSTVVFGVLLVLASRHASPAQRVALDVVGSLLVVGISLSRLALGVHHLADVVGGIVLGVLWLVLAAGALRPGRVGEALTSRSP